MGELRSDHEFSRDEEEMKGRKAQKRLLRRQADHKRGSQSNEAKVKNRWEAGGFHKPGSNNK
jgi:hypothetical protein